MMNDKLRRVFILSIILILTACNTSQDNKEPLDPQNPTTVVVWHYYNGNIKNKFDALITEFNETVGLEKGIVVDAQSQGDVEQLANAVYDSANETIGSDPLPDIFAAYPDNAIRVHELDKLLALNTYFSQEELDAFRDEFLDEGRFLGEDEVYIMPVAKSSETLYVNKTYWDTFASEQGFEDSDLRTWDSLINVAKTYYDETGKGFFGIDSNANFMLISSVQLGKEMFEFSDDNSVRFTFDKKIARKIWNHFYVPYIKGYFVKTGRFTSDDAKTGTVLAYTGSTAGASYFPSEVTFSQERIEAIEPMVLPYPYFEEGKRLAIQQGAGMCITKSNPKHEYASAEFLRWFTHPNQNIRFAISTGYIPVKEEAINEKKMIKTMKEEGINLPTIEASIRATVDMFEEYKFYMNKPFEGSYEIRLLLESHLANKIERDLEKLNNKENQEREALMQELISEAAFTEWYQLIMEEAERILE